MSLITLLKGVVNMLDIFVGLLETKTFLIAIIMLPIIAGTTLPLLYNRLELSQAFHTPERINKNEFNFKKQQQFIKKYNSRIDSRHLELIDINTSKNVLVRMCPINCPL